MKNCTPLYNCQKNVTCAFLAVQFLFSIKIYEEKKLHNFCRQKVIQYFSGRLPFNFENVLVIQHAIVPVEILSFGGYVLSIGFYSYTFCIWCAKKPLKKRSGSKASQVKKKLNFSLHSPIVYNYNYI